MVVLCGTIRGISVVLGSCEDVKGLIALADRYWGDCGEAKEASQLAQKEKERLNEKQELKF